MAYCSTSDRHVVVSLSRDPQGNSSSEVDEAELCPAGWDYLGGSGGSALCLEG